MLSLNNLRATMNERLKMPKRKFKKEKMKKMLFVNKFKKKNKKKHKLTQR